MPSRHISHNRSFLLYLHIMNQVTNIFTTKHSPFPLIDHPYHFYTKWKLLVIKIQINREIVKMKIKKEKDEKIKNQSYKRVTIDKKKKTTQKLQS